MNDRGKTVLKFFVSFAAAFLAFNVFSSSLIRINFPSADFKFSPGPDTQEVASPYEGQRPKNIIVFIADGMGFSHLSLGLLTQHAEDTTASVWREFDVRGWHDARCAYGPLTDSGASATAMACGTSTNNGVIGQDPDGNKLTNVFELAAAQQFATGIVTDSYFWDATPAAFIAHAQSRDDARDIMRQIASSELDLIFGELEDVGEDDVPSKEETLVLLRQRFQLLDETLSVPSGPNSKPIAAIFAEDQVQDMNSSPSLPQMTNAALKYLSSLDKPFVLMVESEEMASASHKNDSRRVLKGLKAIEETVSLILEFSKQDSETLVLFTSDHECGGLAAVSDRNYPKMQIRWASSEHTAAVVPLLATGPGAERFSDVERNWQIGKRLKELVSPSNAEGN